MIGRVSLTAALVAALATQVGAQDANQTASTASALTIEGVVANFQGAQLVPQLLPSLSPQGTLGVVFNNNFLIVGQNLTADAVSDAPLVSFTPASNLSSSTYTSDDRFTLAMVDANIVGTDESTSPQTRHWLVNSVGLNVGATGGWSVNYSSATNITEYAGPGPAAGSGAHRYVVLLYAQPSSFSAPANLSSANTPLGTFFVNSYAQESGLGQVVAATYFQVQNGVATVDVPRTSTVDSMTLAGYGATSTSMQTGSATGTRSGASGSRTSAASGSASATPSGSAGKQGQVGWGVVVGAVGVVGTLLGAGLVL